MCSAYDVLQTWLEPIGGQGLDRQRTRNRIPMINDREFSPVVPLAADAIDAMQSAFDRAWNAVRRCRKRLSAREACDARVRIAHVIFEQVRAGNRDPDRLSDLALSAVIDSSDQATLGRPYL